MTITLRRTVAILLVIFALQLNPGHARAGAQDSLNQLRAAVTDARKEILTNPELSLRKGEALEKTAGQLPITQSRQSIIASALWVQGESLLRLGNFTGARLKIDHATRIVSATMPRSTVAGEVRLSSGGIFAAQANVAAALREYQSAFRIFTEVHDRRSEALALIYIASLYGDGKDYQSALRYASQAMEAYDADPKLNVSLLNNSATYLQELGRSDEATIQFSKARALVHALNIPVLESRIVRNIVRAQLAAGQTVAAETTAREAMAVAARAGGQEGPAMLATLAELAYRRGRSAETLSLIQRSFAGVDTTKTSMSMREAHATAYRVYRAFGNADQALAHLEAMKRLDDESTKLATQTSTALMGARFDFANQELRIARLKADELRRSVQYEQERARTDRWVFAGTSLAALAIMAVLAVTLVLVRRSRDAVEAANRDLERTNEALGQALAAKTEFLATTSHEIRTPLNGILGMTQVMLAEGDLPESALERVRLVHGAGETMRALVDDILDVAKLETGKMTVDSAPFEPIEVLRDAVRLWEEPVRAKGLRFEVLLDVPAGPVLGDAGRLRQILFNLLSNAAKFTERGAIAVRAERAGETFRVSVADTGIGIAPDKLEQVFESFRQADASTTRRFGGTGLGLSISRSLARAMGGELSVASTPGEGTVFTLAVPLPSHAGAAAGAEEEAKPAGEALLIVDRNPIRRAMLRSLAEPHRPVVLVADGPEDALPLIATYAPRDLLVDDAAVGGGLERLVDAARAAGCAVTLLRAADSPIEPPLDVRVVAKPFAGPALVAFMFSDQGGTEGYSPLVTRAA